MRRWLSFTEALLGGAYEPFTDLLLSGFRNLICRSIRTEDKYGRGDSAIIK